MRARSNRCAGAGLPAPAPTIALGAGDAEGLQRNPPAKQPRVLARFVCGLDYLVPFLDVGYVFFWIPGVVLFIAGYPLLFSWWSMMVLPITLLIYGLLRRWQERTSFVASSSIPGTMSWVSAATCSAIGRWSPRPPCAATRSTWPERRDVEVADRGRRGANIVRQNY